MTKPTAPKEAHPSPEDLSLSTEELTALDLCDDAARRELLRKLTRIGLATVPVSTVLLDAKAARANTGSDTGGVVGG